MPFTYKIPIPADLGNQDLILKKWLLDDGDFVDVGCSLAVVSCAKGDYKIQANGRAVMHKHLVEEGQPITDKSQICLLAADGENIPYGKPYSLYQKINKNLSQK